MRGSTTSGDLRCNSTPDAPVDSSTPAAPGAVTESVEITATAPLLDSQTSSLGQVIENRRVVELPLNGRNPFALGLLSGGATPFQGLSTNLPFMAGGGRHSANDILLDGADDTVVELAVVELAVAVLELAVVSLRSSGRRRLRPVQVG